MTNEQREAIEICEHYKNILYACNYEEGTERTGQAIDTVLSLIKEQQKVAEKKDKIIDLMAEYIDENDTCLANYLYKKNGKCNKEMIKQYFKNKVKE